MTLRAARAVTTKAQSWDAKVHGSNTIINP